MKRDSWFHPYAQGPKGENVGSITQPLPSNYLIFRAASESDGEVHVWLLIFFFFFYELNLMKALVPASNNVSFSPGRCWMDALELALSCSSLYKLTAKAGREADISTSSESSHILHLLQSTALSDTELLQ